MTDRLTDEQIARWANQELSHEHGIGSTLVRACRELQERRADVLAYNHRPISTYKIAATIPVGHATAEFLEIGHETPEPAE